MWTDFFFATEAPQGLAVFRIAFGVVLFLDALTQIRYARYFLRPDALYPVDSFKANGLRSGFSLFHLLPVKQWSVNIVLATYLFCSVGVMLGAFTRIAAVGVFICLVSIQKRARFCLHSGDTMLALLSFLLIFSNAGKAYSVDELLFGPQEDGTIWAHRLMQIQVAVLYLHATLWKLKGTTWRRGESVYYATNLVTHRIRQIPNLLNTRSVFRFATYSTLLVEGSLGVLVWFPRVKYWVLGAAVLLHASINYLMRMHLFQVIMIVSFLVFLESGDAKKIVDFITMRGNR